MLGASSVSSRTSNLRLTQNALTWRCTPGDTHLKIHIWRYTPGLEIHTCEHPEVTTNCSHFRLEVLLLTYLLRALAPGGRFPLYFARFLDLGCHQESLQKASAADLEENVSNRAFPVVFATSYVQNQPWISESPRRPQEGRHQESLQKASVADLEENVPNRTFL